MMISKTLDRIVNRMPAIPYLTRRRRTPVAAYVLGGIALALVSGIAALMLFSPRTRGRALNAAKGTYGKMNRRIVHRGEKALESAPTSQGEVEAVEQPTTGV